MIKYLLAAFLFCCNVGYSVAFEYGDEDSPAVFFANDAKRHIKTNSVSKIDFSGTLKQLVSSVANRHNVPVKIAHAIVKVESNYNCNARSSAGAVGIMQTLPTTARGMGVTGRLTDCRTSLEAGMRYLSVILKNYGSGCAAMGLYERGMYAKPVCTSYGRKVIRLASL